MWPEWMTWRDLLQVVVPAFAFSVFVVLLCLPAIDRVSTALKVIEGDEKPSDDVHGSLTVVDIDVTFDDEPKVYDYRSVS